MNFKTKKKNLIKIYENFETQTYEYRKHAVCKPGCAFCCTTVGNIDITTLEGLVILDKIDSFPKKLKIQIKNKIAKNKRDKENSNLVKCPFLQYDNTCLIYDIRPFSCRQLYSLEKCQTQGPTIHREAAELAKQSIKQLQHLDDTGYSGHISYIIHLLKKSEFKKTYLSGEFNPGQIMDFGKAHGIVINSFVS